jgi:hypothetical protein
MAISTELGTATRELKDGQLILDCEGVPGLELGAHLPELGEEALTEGRLQVSHAG